MQIKLRQTGSGRSWEFVRYEKRDRPNPNGRQWCSRTLGTVTESSKELPAVLLRRLMPDEREQALAHWRSVRAPRDTAAARRDVRIAVTALGGLRAALPSADGETLTAIAQIASDLAGAVAAEQRRRASAAAAAVALDGGRGEADDDATPSCASPGEAGGQRSADRDGFRQP